MAERSLTGAAPGTNGPNFAEGDWEGLRRWCQETAEQVGEVAGLGRNTRGNGTYIFNRKWPRASSQKDGLLTKIFYRVLFGLYDLNADETTTAGVVYVGIAAKGAATSAASWLIMEFYDLTDQEDDYKVRFADGDELFDNIWDNRATLTYKEVRLDDRNKIVSIDD